jgi:conjugative relaxase-like TrwC/TraI family protein
MLTIHEVTSATDAKNYYAASDYYSQGQETVGKWGGKLAQMLGLAGKVTKEAFDRMVDNLHPETGKRLTQRTKENRRVGYDFTVSVPKSASLLRAFAGEGLAGELDAARDRAITGMMAEIEADMQTRVRKDGESSDRTTGNMAWAAFHHTTSRPVKGQPPDPHEHTHLLVFNATMDPEENRMKAGQFGNLKRDGEYFAAVFDSHYARELEKLGFVIDRQGGKKWEIAGIPASMVDTFSKRTDEVEDEAARRGIVDAARKAELGAKTRSRKQKELTPAELREAWDAQLTDSERDALAAVYARGVAPGREVTAAEAVAWAIAHVSDKLSVMPERELKRVALLYGLGSLTSEQVAAELPRQGVITSEIDGRLYATTEELQREEDYIAGQAAGGRGSVAPVGVAEGLTRTLKGGKPLNDGQWDAVRGLLDSENRVNLVEGPAGAGKSSLLAKYDEGMRLAGKDVHYFATTAAAVKVLHDDGFTATKTVAHLLLDEKLQAAMRGSRAVVDETSLLGHKDAVKLFRLAEKLDLKLTFVGDPMQHGAVSRGALMRVLKDYGGVRPFKLTEILRQENKEYREAARLLSEGRTVEGFDAIDGMGRIEEIADPQERYRRMADDYKQALDDRKSVLVVSPTHAEAKHITAAIRSGLRDAGKLGTLDREFTRLVQVDSTEAERTLATTYRPGDVIQFHQNARGFTKGQRLVVADPAAVPLEHAGKFSLYRPETIALTEGDRIRFTGNVKTVDGEHTLKNGMAHTVAGFTAKGIKLENGWVVPGDAGHFRHGFVETSFGSQGRTVQRVILGMPVAAMPAMNMQQLYVSASRAKEWIRLYTDDKADIREAVKRSSLKLAALDLPKRPEPPFKPSDGLERHMERRRRLSVVNWMRSAWDRATGGREKPKDKQKERQADHGYGR